MDITIGETVNPIALGEYDGSTITLNRQNIEKEGGSLSNTLAHEAGHRIDRRNGRYQGDTLKRILTRENRSFGRGALVDIGLQRNGRHYSVGDTGSDVRRKINRNLRSYCKNFAPCINAIPEWFPGQ